MSVLFRCRVDKALMEKVNSVTQRLGTDTGQVCRMFLEEIARTGRIPLTAPLERDKEIVSTWEQRAETLASFYDKSETW